VIKTNARRTLENFPRVLMFDGSDRSGDQQSYNWRRYTVLMSAACGFCRLREKSEIAEKPSGLQYAYSIKDYILVQYTYIFYGIHRKPLK
jgi:hypothetical protein